jgi:hypothetical protein
MTLLGDHLLIFNTSPMIASDPMIASEGIGLLPYRACKRFQPGLLRLECLVLSKSFRSPPCDSALIVRCESWSGQFQKFSAG